MQHFSLAGTRRESVGKAALKALRKQGFVPCNLYGNGIENVMFTVNAKELKGLTDTPASYVVDLTLDGKDAFTVVLHETQWHPVTDECLHADFLAVSDAKPVSINVPLEITGHAVGVQQGGKFYQSSRELRISALLANLPDKITVDISDLGLDKRIRVSDVHVDKVAILTDKDTIICGVKATRNSAK